MARLTDRDVRYDIERRVMELQYADVLEEFKEIAFRTHARKGESMRHLVMYATCTRLRRILDMEAAISHATRRVSSK